MQALVPAIAAVMTPDGREVDQVPRKMSLQRAQTTVGKSDSCQADLGHVDGTS